MNGHRRETSQIYLFIYMNFLCGCDPDVTCLIRSFLGEFPFFFNSIYIIIFPNILSNCIKKIVPKYDIFS